MRTPTHHLFGATVALAALRFVPELAPDGWGGVLFATVSTATAGGVLSPDFDQRWKRLDGLVNDEVLGGGGPLQHRGILHSWMIPAAVAALTVSGALPATVPSAVMWGVAVGWGTHVIGDWAFGRANHRVGLRRGVPAFLWYRHVGLGFKADGITERAVATLLVLALSAVSLQLTIEIWRGLN